MFIKNIDTSKKTNATGQRGIVGQSLYVKEKPISSSGE